MKKQSEFDHSNSKYIFEQLETRQLFSGGIEGIIVAETTSPATYVFADTESPTATIIEEIRLVSRADTHTQEIVFIDTAVVDYQILLDGLLNNNRNIDVVLLDSNQDGIEQISTALDNYQHLDAIHVIAHGDDGTINLGNTRLNESTLFDNRFSIVSWADSFSDGADMLIYGCNLAETQVGKELINSLSELTQTDVAASADLTGHESHGGDWDLEYAVGVIQTSVVIDAETQGVWSGLLDITSGLQGHWTFDADATDSSSNNYDGTLAGDASINTTPAANQIGPGNLSLDGSGDFVNLNSHISSLEVLTEGTITAWINTTDNAESTIFSLSDSGASLELVKFSIDGGQVKWLNYNDGLDDTVVYSTATVNDGTWHHVAITVDATGNRIYIDGALVSVSYSQGSSASSSFFDEIIDIDSISIGQSVRASTVEGSFNGSLDDVRLYDRALSVSDITELATVNTAPVVDLNSGLVIADQVVNGDFLSGALNWVNSGDGGFNADYYDWSGNTEGTLTYSPLLTNLDNGAAASGSAQLELNIKWANLNPDNAIPRQLSISIDGVLYAAMITAPNSGTTSTINYFNGATGNLSTTTVDIEEILIIDLPADVASSGHLIFTASASSGDDFFLELVQVLANTDAIAGNNYTASFTEDGAAVSIASANSSVQDDDNTSMTSATITLNNPQTGDRLLVAGSSAPSGTLVSGINWTRSANLVTLSGTFTNSDYATAIESVQFETIDDNPATTPRNISVVVNDGIVTSAIATSTINVIAVNDAPTATNSTVVTIENTNYTFTAADFNYSDEELDTLASVQITSLESIGSLQLSGVDVTLNQVITKADIDGGNLTFVPVANANGISYDSFGFSVNDGTVDSLITYTQAIDVTAVNDLPTFPVTNGILIQDVGSGGTDSGYAIGNQADGKMLVAGNSNNQLTLTRYNADGSTDISFGILGTVTFSSDVLANDVLVASDGKITVVGLQGANLNAIRFLLDGTLDSTFGGGDGLIVEPTNTADTAEGALQSDGKLVVGINTETGENSDPDYE